MIGSMDHSREGPNLAQYSDAPRYNILAVEKATGVSPRTLRSWERRYGLPDPHRDAGRRRLYSERDVALIRWLTARVGEGISIGRAVAMLSQEESVAENPNSSPDLERFQLMLLQAIDRMDEDDVTDVLSAALQTAPVESVVLQLIRPVLYRVGDLWAAGRMSVATEHFGTHVLRSRLTELMRGSAGPRKPYHILVGSAPGDQHDVGALVFSLFLRRAGYRVTYLGASVESVSLRADLEHIQPHALCLSATTFGAAEGLADLYAALSQTFAGLLAYGGSAFDNHAPERRAIPGMLLDLDVRRAVEMLGDALRDGQPAP